MNIGETIRTLRREAGYTQKQLAGIMGANESYLSALERGVRRPGKKILPLLCDALAVDEATIIYGPRGAHDRPLTADESALLAETAGLSGKQRRLLIEFIKMLKTFGASAEMLLRAGLPSGAAAAFQGARGTAGVRRSSEPPPPASRRRPAAHSF